MCLGKKRDPFVARKLLEPRATLRTLALAAAAGEEGARVARVVEDPEGSPMHQLAPREIAPLLLGQEEQIYDGRQTVL
jgi:hypothetical protein